MQNTDRLFGLIFYFFKPLSSKNRYEVLMDKAQYFWTWPPLHNSPRVAVGSVAQSCPTVCNPMDCSLPGSSIHEIFQAREYWSGLPFPSPGDLPDPGVEPGSPALQADTSPSVTREATVGRVQLEQEWPWVRKCWSQVIWTEVHYAGLLLLCEFSVCLKVLIQRF